MPDYILSTTTKPSLDTMLQEQSQMLHDLNATLEQTQRQMAHPSNHSCSHHSFNVKDWVLLHHSAH